MQEYNVKEMKKHQMFNDLYENKKRIEKNCAYAETESLEKITFFEKLIELEKKYGIKTAITEGEKSVSFTELKVNSLKYASYFISKGIGRGSTVIVQIPNSILFAEVCFGLWRIGAVPVFTIPSLRFAELNGIVKSTGPIAYLAQDEHLGFNYHILGEQLKCSCPTIQHLMFSSELERVYDSFPALSDSNIQYPEYYDVALLLLSSGTTGIPKLIPRSHADYICNASLAAGRFGVTEESVYLLVLPIQHTFGFALPGLLGTLINGGRVVMCKVASPDYVLPLIEEERVNIVAMVPSFVAVLMEFMECDNYDVSSIKKVLVGGSLLMPTLGMKIQNTFPGKLYQVYGFSEGLITSTHENFTPDIIASCVGTPLSSADIVKIVDDKGKEVGQGEIGELIVKGPYTITSYYMNDDANHTAFTEDGFYRSGDKARITDEGNIQIIGRVREQINRAGEKIMPSEIEENLCMMPEIEAAAVVGATDEILGQIVFVFIIPSNGKEISIEIINRFFDNLGVCAYKRPDVIKIIDKMPLTTMGKLDKKELQKISNEIYSKGE